MTSSSTASRRELDRLTETPDAMLDDIGVSRSQVEVLRTANPALWARMAAATGADVHALSADPAALREVATICALCDARGRCRRLLDSGTAGTPGFCPNQATLDGLPRARAAARSHPPATPRGRRSVALTHLSLRHPDF